ncbi:hypothetical protein [Streptococcus orisratti]|uniref:hypothetical protein n=1 Tax=Streptococcus orisratti TaxID=114652 RepID=UPI00294263DC|nr:hypothetical protein [Streptococcus orisratti]
MAKFIRYCIQCGKRFETDSNVSKYCSDKCRKVIKNERQRKLMKEKRLKNKVQKSKTQKSFANRNVQKLSRPEYTDPYKRQMDTAHKNKDWNTYYTLFKEQYLANEKEWGYLGRYVVNGFEIHDPDFVSNIVKTIE